MRAFLQPPPAGTAYMYHGPERSHTGTGERDGGRGEEEEAGGVFEEGAGISLSRFKARSLYDRQQRSKLKTIREKSQSTDAILNNSDCT